VSTDACRRAGVTNNAIAIYENFQRAAVQHHSCPLCTRKFEQDAALQEFVAKVMLSVESGRV
jgi:hypothetical protein